MLILPLLRQQERVFHTFCFTDSLVVFQVNVRLYLPNGQVHEVHPFTAWELMFTASYLARYSSGWLLRWDYAAHGVWGCIYAFRNKLGGEITLVCGNQFCLVILSERITPPSKRMTELSVWRTAAPPFIRLSLESGKLLSVVDTADLSACWDVSVNLCFARCRGKRYLTSQARISGTDSINFWNEREKADICQRANHLHLPSISLVTIWRFLFCC